MKAKKNGPQFSYRGNLSLSDWAWKICLPWLVENLGLVAGAICGSIPERIRRQVLGLGEDENLPEPIDWSKNGIIISPPGTGKGMAVFVEALGHFSQVFVLVPSVIQAHKLEESLDTLYHRDLGGCLTSQRRSSGLVKVITTGIFQQMVRDKNSDLWREGSCLFVDEAQRILEDDPETEFMVGYAAAHQIPTYIVSATIAPGNLPEVFGSPENPAKVYELAREMHPVEIHLTKGTVSEILAQLPALRKPGKTTLVFCSSRSQVMALVNSIKRDQANPCHAVGITGAHMVEEQLEMINHAQKKGLPVVVIGTPGTVDSSVTIPGLETVIIDDSCIQINWNEYGVMERRHQGFSINHIWQMIRRVGRIARTDGQKDQVCIVSESDRADVQTNHPEFQILKGCSPDTPIENMLLEAVALDVPFAKVHDFMLSTFSKDHIKKTTEKLLDQGMIRQVDNPNDPDGLELTSKGALVVSLPYEYCWSKLIVEASEDLRLWLAMAASSDDLRNLQMFEDKGNDEIEPQEQIISEVVEKIILGIDYVSLGDDHLQKQQARYQGMSFRRLEQMETLFTIGCEALEIDWSPESLEKPSGQLLAKLVNRIVLGGLNSGLLELYLVAQGNKGGWSEARTTADGKTRRFFVNQNSKLGLKENAQGGVCAIVARATWFSSRSGMALANLSDVTIVPNKLVTKLVGEEAEKQGWFGLTFFGESFRGKTQMAAKSEDGWTKYLSSRADNEPVEGISYWCSIDREIARGVKTVWVHYPVD